MGYTLDPPPEVFNSWPDPNYDNPDTRGPGLIIITIMLMVAGCFVITVRTYTRLTITRAFGTDDVLILIAWSLSVALSILVILGNLIYHSGYHIWDIPPTLYVAHRKNIWWSELIYVLASCIIKVSVLLFYRRLSTQFPSPFLWAVRAGLALTFLYFICFAGLLFTICSPLSAYWNIFDTAWTLENPHFFCHAENVALPISAGLSVVTDLYATVVPLWLVASLPKSFKDKIGLYIIFSLGFLVVLFGILRTYYVYAALNVNYDFTWILYDCWLYTQLELNLAIIAACAPAMRPLVLYCSRVRKKFQSVFRDLSIRPVSQRFSTQTEKTYTNSVPYGPGGMFEDVEYSSNQAK